MKALSFKQPYAWLMLHGKIETRPWDTQYRGQVLICASARAFSWDQVEDISGEWQFGRILKLMQDHNTTRPLQPDGVAIAVGELVDTHPMYPHDEDQAFVQLDTRLYSHIYANVRPIQPFPFKGAQRWKNLDQSTIDQIKYL